MSLIVPIGIQNTSIQTLLSVNLKLKLFSNNYTPNASSVVGSFTEVSGGGYVAKDLLYTDWSYGVTSPVVATQAVKTFSFTGAIGGSGNVYGYYVTDNAGTTLYWAESFTYFTPANGAYVRIYPTLTLSGGA